MTSTTKASFTSKDLLTSAMEMANVKPFSVLPLRKEESIPEHLKGGLGSAIDYVLMEQERRKRTIGKISDDGDAWVDEHSGEVICPIDFDVSEGYKEGLSNQATASQQNSCNLDVESHLLKRQARMGLLEKDKIALRITVPWSPELNVGKLIGLVWNNKKSNQTDQLYGSGTYLVASLMHKIHFGGFAVTTMDCVAQTAGGGIV